MSNISRKHINWEKTGRNLLILRNDNLALRRNVCRALNYDKNECSGLCEDCRYDIDMNISRAELAKIFNVSDSVIFNWESGKTPVGLEDMLFYCAISGVKPEDIIVFD